MDGNQSCMAQSAQAQSASKKLQKVIKHKRGPKLKRVVGERALRKRHGSHVLSSRGALLASELPQAGCTEVFIGIGGVPGAGKSHVMKELMRSTDGDFDSMELRPLIPAMRCGNLTIIGKSYSTQCKNFES